MSANDGSGKGRALGGSKDAQKKQKSGKQTNSVSSNTDKPKTAVKRGETGRPSKSTEAGAKVNDNIKNVTKPEGEAAAPAKAPTVSTKGAAAVAIPTQASEPKINALAQTKSTQVDPTKQKKSTLTPAKMNRQTQPPKFVTPSKQVQTGAKSSSQESVAAPPADSQAKPSLSKAQTKPSAAEAKSTVSKKPSGEPVPAPTKSTSQTKSSTIPAKSIPSSKAKTSLPKSTAPEPQTKSTGPQTRSSTATKQSTALPKTAAVAKSAATAAKSDTAGPPKAGSALKVPTSGQKPINLKAPTGKQAVVIQAPAKTRTMRKVPHEAGKRHTRRTTSVSKTKMPSSWTPGAENLTPPLKLRPRGDRVSHEQFPNRKSRTRSRSNDAMGEDACRSPLLNSGFASPCNVASPASATAVCSPMGMMSPPQIASPAQAASPLQVASPPREELAVKSAASPFTRKRSDEKSGSSVEKSADANATNASTHSTTSSILENHQAELNVFTINKLLRKPVPARSKERLAPPVKNAQGQWVEPPVFVFGDPRTGQSMWKRGRLC